MQGDHHGWADDRAFLGLETTGDGTAAFELASRHTRPDAHLFGGTAMAAAIAMAEQVTGRPALWMTVQFVSGAGRLGDRIELAAEVRAHGKRAAQVRVSATTGDQLLFDAVGATARAEEGADVGVFESMPAVRQPTAGERWKAPGPSSPANGHGFLDHVEIRQALAEDPDDDAYRLWTRIPGTPATAAVLGFLADWVPSGVVHALGKVGGGRSIDNTLRLGSPAPAEWVLVDVDPHLARDGYGHGTARLWSEDGALLAMASQTSALIAFDR
jgi:acyl-CoA thioesterase